MKKCIGVCNICFLQVELDSLRQIREFDGRNSLEIIFLMWYRLFGRKDVYTSGFCPCCRYELKRQWEIPGYIPKL